MTPQENPQKLLYTRLSAYYFFHFAALGALMPYWGPYLADLGFSEERIGILFALLLGTKIIAPNLWGWLADRRGRRMGMIRGGALLAFACFSGLLLGTSFWLIALVMLGFGFFWNAILPQFEANTLNHLGSRDNRYSLVRMWGSVGFIIAVVGIGTWLESNPIEQLPLIVLAVLAGILVVTLAVPEAPRPAHSETRHSALTLLKDVRVWSLFLCFFLMQASHGPYYSFFSLFLERHGYGPALIGWLWALGVIAEIGVFLAMPRLLPRFGARRLLLFAFAATTVRWLMIAAFVDKLGVVLLAQVLHLASFGIYHAIAVHFVHRYFTGHLQGRGQALYSSLGFGAGGAAGSLVAGFLWNSVSPASIFVAAAGMAFVALLIAARGVEDIGRSNAH